MNRQKDKLKISILTPNFSKGGVDRAYLLSQVCKKLNYEVEVLGFLFGENIYPHPPSYIPIYYLPGSNYPQLFASVKQLLLKIDGDIIWAVKPKPTSYGVALIKKIFHGKPVIVDIDDWELSWHGGDEWSYRPTFKRLVRDVFKKEGALRNPDHPLYLKWMESLIKQANAVTADTKFLLNRFGGTYIPNGKDTSLFDPQKFDAQVSRERYGLAEYRVLMFPGAPRPHKGLEDVLMALDQLNELNFRLVIVGGNPYDDYDEKLIARWGRWIIKLPPVPIEKMPEIVAAAHVVIVPQRDTPVARAQFPIKLTDGMAMAKPVLATRVGDIPEILDETGYLVDPSSPEQIAEKIQWIFEHLDEAKEKGKMSRARCVKHYSINTMASTLSEICSQLVT
ncbi:glycosyltransferase family 4 protein [Umezakia ovalisporum]|jgi:glycosyltransferase involved in cell wall biosynthesis|uniref:Glycosyltransferase family 4 protein n=2 Tax=Umezakia ovalisporum TaxID=75695 RepID=A0AA43GYN8_9CYAN|nr:glycosyltransferase family 4 protein [Umezakia ovalisporum]MBI1240624.1 glycosyltransferase [Nostoc sp. RI_552]MDH6058347.1 glycosyltransferase family 4 protein [Umezakia ovalisporum FSS-43]MDH6063939.1 glycosyltransferase family 4 protein [Umezakia ovalisporum FSS-62]MDH6067694.1 glycosyltransferase family 4 protein [Umezakia ovalisporum APH033B]MDH6071494.1 glycosyltransferase family 4 protein [Umezakia ovalisporum CobakiLakeA]